MSRWGNLCLQSCTALLLAACLSGCLVGPTSIAAGRSLYNEVINRTEDEQLLSLIVHDRYYATYGMLAVSSVTANIRANASVNAQFGLSRSLEEDYAGNLVPLSTGVLLETNPTISYVPLGGEEFVRRLLSPLSLDEALMISQYLGANNRFVQIGIKSVNNVSNPILGAQAGDTATVERAGDLWRGLIENGVLQIVRDDKGGIDASFYISTPDQQKKVIELLELTDVKLRPSGGRLIVPMRLAANGRQGDAFSYETRSVLEILRAAGACIDIPAAHLKTGVIEPLDVTVQRRFIHIRSSRIRPSGLGTIAVLYRGWWYYVADNDPASKQAFQFLRALVGLRLAEFNKDKSAPLLTIPIGK